MFPEENNGLPPPWELVWTGDLYIYENTNWLPRWFIVDSIIPVDSLEDGFDVAQVINPESEAVVVEIDHINIPPGLLENAGDIPLNSSIDLRKYSADEIVLNTTTNRDGFLVISDTFYPGWRAWVDSEEVEIYRTDGIIKGIVVPEGEHKVRFLFDPWSYKTGWIFTLIGLICTPFLLKPLRNLLGN